MDGLVKCEFLYTYTPGMGTFFLGLHQQPYAMSKLLHGVAPDETSAKEKKHFLVFFWQKFEIQKNTLKVPRRQCGNVWMWILAPPRELVSVKLQVGGWIRLYGTRVFSPGSMCTNITQIQ